MILRSLSFHLCIFYTVLIFHLLLIPNKKASQQHLSGSGENKQVFVNTVVKKAGGVLQKQTAPKRNFKTKHVKRTIYELSFRFMSV